jgi:hypothetical protein
MRAVSADRPEGRSSRHRRRIELGAQSRWPTRPGLGGVVASEPVVQPADVYQRGRLSPLSFADEWGSRRTR